MLLSRRLFLNCIFLTLLYIFTCCIHNVKGQSNLSDEKVVLVSPVLAYIKNSRARTVETAKDFPVLRLISNNAAVKNEFKHDNISQPIYVEVSMGRDIPICDVQFVMQVIILNSF